ncbi:hypothetical protein HYV87_02705 [Candidatus Woesearchaeota archaeon]|nr:hypothetical protein [Candidatus Woesearchaeota archaeon]
MLTNEECRQILQNKNLKEEDINRIATEISLLADLLLDIFFEQNKQCQSQKE